MSDERFCSSGSSLQASPMVSVIIPNCNGRQYLQKCIPSIVDQIYKNLELVLVDNGSTDGSVEFIKNVFPHAKSICNDRNLGFATAVNQGVRASSGKYVFILNNDTVLEPNCVQVLVDAMLERRRRGQSKVIGLAPKILLIGRPIIDAIGNHVNRDGAAFNVGIGQVDFGQFDKSMRVIGLCFAAGFIERSAFDSVGFLDESYFAYYEDVDWCYRANVFGFEFFSEPRALVHHYHSGSVRTLMTSDQKYYLIHRNLLRTVLKNYFWGNLIYVAPRLLVHVARTTLTYVRSASQNIQILKSRRARLHAKILAVTLLWLPILLAKNVGVNRRRILSDDQIWRIASERLVQASGLTFDPSTYSPVVTLDVMEEIFLHLARNVGRKEYVEAYLGVHAINNLVEQSSLRLSPRLVEELIRVTPKHIGLRVKGLLGYRIGGMVFIMHEKQSYVVDQFLLNLILIMNGRTLEEVGRVLVENALAKKKKPSHRDAGMSVSNLVQIFVIGLQWIAAYLARLGFVEGCELDALST